MRGRSRSRADSVSTVIATLRPFAGKGRGPSRSGGRARWAAEERAPRPPSPNPLPPARGRRGKIWVGLRTEAGSCEDVLQQKIERLVEIDMGNAVAFCAGDAGRLKDRELGEPLAPEAAGRRHHRYDAGEEPDAALAAFGQSDDDV